MVARPHPLVPMLVVGGLVLVALAVIGSAVSIAGDALAPPTQAALTQRATDTRRWNAVLDWLFLLFQAGSVLALVYLSAEGLFRLDTHRRTRHLVRPGRNGVLPTPAEVLDEAGPRTALAFIWAQGVKSMAQLAIATAGSPAGEQMARLAALAPGQMPSDGAPRSPAALPAPPSYRSAGEPTAPIPALVTGRPEPVSLLPLLQDRQCSLGRLLPLLDLGPDEVLLGFDELTGEPITLFLASQPDRRFPHMAIAGPTQRGKTSAAAGLLGWLRRAGADLLVLTPHYAKNQAYWDALSPHHWRGLPIPRPTGPSVLTVYPQIEAAWRLVEAELHARLAGRTGRPLVVFADELAGQTEHCPTAAKLIKSLLRESLGVDIILLAAAQDFQTQTFPRGVMTSAVRSNFGAALVVGGKDSDDTTQDALLGPGGPWDMTNCGRGVGWLKADEGRAPVRARLPLTTPADLAALLAARAGTAPPPSLPTAPPIVLAAAPLPEPTPFSPAGSFVPATLATLPPIDADVVDYPDAADALVAPVVDDRAADAVGERAGSGQTRPGAKPRLVLERAPSLEAEAWQVTQAERAAVLRALRAGGRPKAVVEEVFGYVGVPHSSEGRRVYGLVGEVIADALRPIDFRDPEDDVAAALTQRQAAIVKALQKQVGWTRISYEVLDNSSRGGPAYARHAEEISELIGRLLAVLLPEEVSGSVDEKEGFGLAEGLAAD